MTIKTQLIKLRKEYKTASDERKKEILSEANSLKNKACYECHENDRLPEEDEHYPYCSAECHKTWGDKNYGDNRPKGQRQLQVKEIQRRLKEMGK